MTVLGPATVSISEGDSGWVVWLYSSPLHRRLGMMFDDLTSEAPQLRDLPLREGTIEVPRAVISANSWCRLLDAAMAALHGNDDVVDNFTQALFSVPAARAARWREAVSLALLGSEWYLPFIESGNGFPVADMLRVLRREVGRVHRQLQPLWERKIGGHRVHLLEKPVAGGLALRDLVTDGSGPDQTVLRTVLDDLRLASVLARLSPAERAVARAWAYGGAATWREAAVRVGAADPAGFGERVRRKLRRHGREYLRRRTAATESGLWLPPRATPAAGDPK